MLGFCYELLQPLLDSEASVGALDRYCDALARGHLAKPVYDCLALSKLTPAKKGLKGKLRPLIMSCNRGNSMWGMSNKVIEKWIRALEMEMGDADKWLRDLETRM